ncbi:HVO_A0114 family putative DNA-binding protein [Pseudidiomarina homiensis]|uniref:HVO_A0114 family putative DNA-binding protein n=1 Tax=Pseudidiomarina homiensis TaxID=364198 RepID=UPI00215A892F|nr:helix-turn-helix domain-containing protein [Pseudidiomarina homiensis]
MSVMHIGVKPQSEIRARLIAIAKGEVKPENDEPRVWFPSIRSLAEILSDQNRDLLKIIAANKPQSLKELAVLSGRAPSNLSRSLKTMSHYGLVKMEKHEKSVRPIALATEFHIHI